jgi:hypothetical protein
MSTEGSPEGTMPTVSAGRVKSSSVLTSGVKAVEGITNTLKVPETIPLMSATSPELKIGLPKVAKAIAVDTAQKGPHAAMENLAGGMFSKAEVTAADAQLHAEQTQRKKQVNKFIHQADRERNSLIASNNSEWQGSAENISESTPRFTVIDDFSNDKYDIDAYLDRVYEQAYQENSKHVQNMLRDKLVKDALDIYKKNATQKSAQQLYDSLKKASLDRQIPWGEPACKHGNKKAECPICSAEGFGA